jgi:cellulose synthase/poly-beta-1,6-N-acetylglucosamine synthase-like glycosyltransferase
MFDLILIFSAIFYAGEIILFLLALSKKEKKHKHIASFPNVSVVVAARNEEENIERCLRSILQVDYPADKLEVVVADDGSTDRTPEIISKIKQEHNNLKVIRIESQINNLKGKQTPSHRQLRKQMVSSSS